MKHCLVADDSHVVRKVARQILESMNIGVTEAENGRDAVDQCVERMPHAVLLDWDMPVMNGLEFIGALRLAAKGDRPHIIYCVTENDPVEISRALVGGADDSLLKPYDRATLSEKLVAARLLETPPAAPA